MKLFVYGTLKKGFGNHFYLENAKFLYDFEWKTDEYKLVSLGYFPAIIPSFDKKERSIFGEVYAITEEELFAIDVLEGYPQFYDRKIIKGKNGEDLFVYILNESRHNVPNFGAIESGVWNDVGYSLF